MRLTPGSAIGPREQQGGRFLARTHPGEEFRALISYMDVAGPAVLRKGDMDDFGVAVVVASPHGGKFAISASREQRTGYECSELPRTGIDQPLGLSIAQIADLRRVGLAEWPGHLPAFRCIGSLIVHGQVQGGLEDG